MNAFRSSQKRSSREKFLRAKKSLGQNFLVDKNVIGKIVEACAFKKDDRVLEIGPGTGALTREIVSRVGHFIAIETDRRLWAQLTEEFKGTHAQIIHADFLKWDLTNVTPAKAGAHSMDSRFRGNDTKIKVFGNLPYYISTPIITKIIEHRRLFSEFYLTVQWEFAQRIIAQPGTEDYSSFSCFVQFFAEPRIFFKIKNTCFRPAPKVDSCFLKLTLRDKPLHEVDDEEFLFKVIRLGFGQRRKMLLNALSVLMAKDQMSDILKSIGIAPTARAESLSLQQFVALASALKPSASGKEI